MRHACRRYIYEDTSRHQNDAMWAYDVKSKKLTRIMSSPYGAEVTGGQFVERVGKWSYLMSVIQHPYGESDQTKTAEKGSTGTAGYVGAFGPFPASWVTEVRAASERACKDDHAYVHLPDCAFSTPHLMTPHLMK